jgi:hypothetical protein
MLSRIKATRFPRWLVDIRITNIIFSKLYPSIVQNLGHKPTEQLQLGNGAITLPQLLKSVFADDHHYESHPIESRGGLVIS